MSDPTHDDPQPQPVDAPPLTLKWDVRQGIPELHLAILGILVSIGLAVGFGVRAAWPIAVASGIAITVLLALVLRWQKTRALLVKVAEWILH